MAVESVSGPAMAVWREHTGTEQQAAQQTFNLSCMSALIAQLNVLPDPAFIKASSLRRKIDHFSLVAMSSLLRLPNYHSVAVFDPLQK